MKIKGLLRECLVGVGCARKTSFLIALNGCLAASLFAQNVVPPPVQLTATPQPSAQVATSPGETEKLTPEALNQLLAPIALYPDALIALMLPASTISSEIVLASRYLGAGGKADQAGGESWDESVKGLLNYPDILKWMDENLEWTSTLGTAFVNQPADVMSAIQYLRATAKAAGNLANTPQQIVVQEEEVIRIVPAEPEVIYVPVAVLKAYP